MEELVMPYIVVWACGVILHSSLHGCEVENVLLEQFHSVLIQLTQIHVHHASGSKKDDKKGIIVKIE